MTSNLVLEVIDMRVPRQIAQHDKLGYKNFLSAMKAILFCDSSYRMNERRCEEFFEDEGNFVLPNQCRRMQPEGTEAQWAKESMTEETCGAIIKWEEATCDGQRREKEWKEKPQDGGGYKLSSE